MYNTGNYFSKQHLNIKDDIIYGIQLDTILYRTTDCNLAFIVYLI